ncbi:hypothetical protein KSD_59910 [Ktedonobacter sp. SOSP1-85]|nr:hypothetical protein KSD_59910 [Ktedonobacter sp. SOSP1-85]
MQMIVIMRPVRERLRNTPGVFVDGTVLYPAYACDATPEPLWGIGVG